MQLKAFKKFNLELNKIELFYQITMFPYGISMKAIEQDFFDNHLDELNRFFISEKDDKILISKRELKSKFGKKLPKEIAELVFIRIISVLEIFMISQVRELFLVRTDLFHSNDKIEFSRGEILNSKTVTELWKKLIDRELRNLQNQSLDKKSKYFLKYLNINFKQSSEYTYLRFIHDVRHVIVHRLGKTDDQFREKYPNSNSHITINPDDLIQAIATIRNFGQFIFEQASTLIKEQVHSRNKFEAFAKIQILKDQIYSIFSLDYKFIDDKDSLIWCSDFIKRIHDQDGVLKIEILGDKDAVISYLRQLKKLEKGWHIRIISLLPKNWSEHFGIPGRKLTQDEIKELAKNLPIQPWEKGIHKKIAKRLNTSNKVVSNAIDKILKDPNLMKSIGQDVKYNSQGFHLDGLHSNGFAN